MKNEIKALRDWVSEIHDGMYANLVSSFFFEFSELRHRLTLFDAYFPFSYIWLSFRLTRRRRFFAILMIL